MNTKRKLTFEIDIEKATREQVLELIDKVLAYDFVGFYNDNNITGILYKKEKKVTQNKEGGRR